VIEVDKNLPDKFNQWMVTISYSVEFNSHKALSYISIYNLLFLMTWDCLAKNQALVLILDTKAQEGQ
jgi:hypothetical protein